MYVISGKKRESSPFRHIVKSLMHPYSVRSGYTASQLSPIIKDSRNSD